MTAKNDNMRKGEVFERYIASLYESLNFTVSTNINIRGQQVDIFAEKFIQGAGHTNLIIECKFLTKGNVSNQVVHEFGAFMTSINNPIYRGVLVTNSDFTKDASTAAEANNITLLTQDQLEVEILGFKEPYFKAVKDFEKDEIFSEYIPQLGVLNNKDESVKIEETIVNYSYNDWRRISFLTVLADYGAGKTTLLERLNYIFAKKHLEGGRTKPIFFELKRFHKHGDLDSFLINRFIKVFQKELPIELIWKGIERGDFLILLDGFDEMSPQVNSEIRNENFMKLAPLLLSNSNTIITCRPSYFISKDEYQKSVNRILKSNRPPRINDAKGKARANKRLQSKIYQNLIAKYSDDNTIHTESRKIGARNEIITISDFSEPQIDAYLEKFDEKFKLLCGASWIEVKNFLVSIYDIRSLLKKPILLSMIKDTMLDLGVDYNKNNDVYDPASLYEIYTNANIVRDWSKGQTRQFLSKTQRLAFAETLAYQMFIKDDLEINYGSIISLVKKNKSMFNDITNYSIEEIAADLQICTFIRRTEDDMFRFIHKSFMEFFVAKKLKKEFLGKMKNELHFKLIPKDILYFLGCYCTADPILDKRFAGLTSPKRKVSSSLVLRRNTSIAYLLSRPFHAGVNFQNVLLDMIDLENLSFRDCVLDSLELRNVTFSSTNFDKCELTNSSLFNCFLRKVVFESSAVNIIVEDSIINLCEFKKCGDVQLRGGKVQLEDVNITQCAGLNIESSSKGLMIGSSVDQCTMIIHKKGIGVDSSTINGTRIILESDSLHLSITKISGCSFEQFDDGILRNRRRALTIDKSTVVDSSFSFEHNILISESASTFQGCTFFCPVILSTQYTTKEQIFTGFINCRGLIVLENCISDRTKYYRVGDLILVTEARKNGFIASMIDS